MIIDINKHKQEHTCENCQYSEHGIRCKNPYYAKFIEETLITGYCEGFERKLKKQNTNMKHS